MELQTIYTKVLQHLARQGGAAKHQGDGAYRGFGGMCAVGCLLTDEAYSPDIENKAVGQTPVDVAVGLSLGIPNFHEQRMSEHCQIYHLLGELQYMHDSLLPAIGSARIPSPIENYDNVDSALRKVERKYNLIRPKVFDAAFRLSSRHS